MSGTAEKKTAFDKVRVGSTVGYEMWVAVVNIDDGDAIVLGAPSLLTLEKYLRQYTGMDLDRDLAQQCVLIEAPPEDRA